MKLLLSACAVGALAAPVLGGSAIFTDLSSFLGQVQPGFYDEGFDGLAGGAVDSLNFSQGGFSYTATSTVGSDPGSLGDGGLFNDPGLLSLNTATDALLIEFTSGNVTAVGGDFFASDISFAPLPADVIITLADGTSQTLNSDTFVGFTSDVAISSMVIDAPDASNGGNPSWPTVDRLIVGEVIPTPGAAAVLGLAGLFAARRRR